jgi:hypothetical protein
VQAPEPTLPDAALRAFRNRRFAQTLALIALPVATALHQRAVRAEPTAVAVPETPSASAAAAPADAAVTPEAENGRVSGARAAFLRGVELAKIGRWNEALTAFERSNELLRHAVTLFNVGFCERALGHYARAERAFSDAVADDASGASSLPADLRTSARELLAEIRTRRSVAVMVADAPDLALLVDGRPLEPVASEPGRAVYVAGVRAPAAPEPLAPGTVEVRLDPGTHVFQLTRSGRAEPDLVETFLPGETRTLLFRSPLARPEPVHDGVRPASTSQGPGWPAITVASVGVLGIVTGTVFGVLSLTAHSELSSECPAGRCPPSRRDELSRFHTYEDVATGGFVVGAAALAAGGVLWFEAARPAAGAGTRSVPDSRSAKSAARARVSLFPFGVAGTF